VYKYTIENIFILNEKLKLFSRIFCVRNLRVFYPIRHFIFYFTILLIPSEV